MYCITEKIYETLRDEGLVKNTETMSALCGRKSTYLRSVWSKGSGASLSAMITLYVGLHGKIHSAPQYSALLQDMQKLLWINILQKASQRMGANYEIK